MNGRRRSRKENTMLESDVVGYLVARHLAARAMGEARPDGPDHPGKGTRPWRHPVRAILRRVSDRLEPAPDSGVPESAVTHC
jgi:hypothetical protein